MAERLRFSCAVWTDNCTMRPTRQRPLKLAAALILGSQLSVIRQLEQGTWFAEAVLLLSACIVLALYLVRRSESITKLFKVCRITGPYYALIPIALALCMLTFGQQNLLHNLNEHQEPAHSAAPIPMKGFGFRAEDIPLDAREQTFYRNNKVVKRWYQAENMGFLLINIDGSTNQDALHDPAFCLEAAGWRIASEKTIRLSGGTATQVIAHRGDQRRQITWWFNDGSQRHSGLISLQLQA